MRFLLLFFYLLLVSTFSFSQKQIALTFDDLPMALPRISLQHTIDINQKLLSELKKQNVPATGFVNESMINVENEAEERLAILKQWAAQGFELGNHTYHHVSYNAVPLNSFVTEVKKGELYTNQILKEQGKKIKYFRPPFLSTGSTADKKEKLEKFLKDDGYTLALSTIEASDFTFNLIYLKAKFEQDSTKMKRVVKDYLDFTEKRLVYYEMVSDKVVGRAIPQILLVHVNDINADNLDKLLQLLKAHHYEFISLEQALQDSVFNQKDAYVGNRGISWLHRWNETDRMELMKQEPKLPVSIKKQNSEAKQDQFYFLLKSRIIGYHYTAYHIGIFLLVVVLITVVLYILISKRKRNNYLLQ